MTGNFVTFPKFEVEQSHLDNPNFTDCVEKRTIDLVRKYTLTEHKMIAKKLQHQGRLNRMYIEYKIQYSQRTAPLSPVRRGSKVAAKSTRRSLPVLADSSTHRDKGLKRKSEVKDNSVKRKKTSVGSGLAILPPLTEGVEELASHEDRMANPFEDDEVEVLSPRSAALYQENTKPSKDDARLQNQGSKTQILESSAGGSHAASDQCEFLFLFLFVMLLHFLPFV